MTSKSEFASVQMGDQWRFVGGRWEQDQEGLIIPPGNLADENLAFYTACAYGDFEAEFEFRWEASVTTAAFVFRAQDACHYYVVDFPTVGQQYRAEHFWATVSKVDERGYREGLHMEMVHGVSSAVGLWHQARIRVAGDEIRVWVDGRPVTAVRDATYAGPGRIGLATYSNGESATSCYRNLRIRGAALGAPAWDEGLRPARNWGIVDPEYGQGCSNIVRAANGDLLVMAAGKVAGADFRRQRRSSDNGQTWTGDERLVDRLLYGCLRAAPDGRIELYDISESPPFKIRRAVSRDHGKTWSAQRDVGEVRFPPDMPFAYTSVWAEVLLETKDGALLLFARARSDMQEYKYKGRSYPSLRPSANYCFRSTDGGQTWSEPMNMDGPPHDDGFPQFYKAGSEVSAAETLDGKVLALIRHDGIRTPTMLEAWSHDGGRTWKPTSRGQFPMYASLSAMISTTSGALIIGGRFPGLAVEISRDGGMTWNFYQVDTVTWANGAMFEIEPEVVLFTYGGRSSPERLRYQIMRLTQTGLEPVGVTRFDQKLDLDSVAVLPLETTWRFKTDPQKAGTGEEWFAPDMADSDWAQIRTDRYWQTQGYENYHGSAWYRTRLTMPEEFDIRKHLWLFFESVDKETYVYLDGTKVFEHTFASCGLEEAIWDTPFRIDARPLLKPGCEHLMAVRVDSEECAGGIWRPASLISTDSEAPPDLLRDILREKSLQ